MYHEFKLAVVIVVIVVAVLSMQRGRGRDVREEECSKGTTGFFAVIDFVGSEESFALNVILAVCVLSCSVAAPAHSTRHNGTPEAISGR